MNTVKGMLTITVSHVGCSRENQTDRKQKNYQYLCTNPSLIHTSIKALRGHTLSTLVQRHHVTALLLTRPVGL